VRERVIADLRRAGCVYAEDEADELLEVLRSRGLSAASARGRTAVEDYVRRRETGEPAEYILGSAALAGIRVSVGRGVFIPRPWSADLVWRAAELLNAAGEGIGVDLGTGSGAIALAVAKRAPRSRIWATEVNPDAVHWAELNCAGREGLTVCRGDLYEALPGSLRGHVDVIAGSLPYVPTSELAGLPRDHVGSEPVGAFDGGDEGLAVVGRAIAGAHDWLNPYGRILLEIGAGQGPRAAEIAAEAGLAEFVVHTGPEGGELFLEAARELREKRPT